MVIAVTSYKIKRPNFFITTAEARILWQHTKKWSTKWQVMLGLALFRGMRIGEVCACNIYDFQNKNFNKLNIILGKSHIKDEFPILAEFNELIKYYVINNRHRLKDGYLFPFYNSNRNGKYMGIKTASAAFSKWRKEIGKEHPEFLDRTEYMSLNNKIYHRYRISWHSCRRWFETQIWDKYKDKMMLRDIMRYKESRTVDVYIDPYEVWKREGLILEDTFGDLFRDFNHMAAGQTKLTSF